MCSNTALGAQSNLVQVACKRCEQMDDTIPYYKLKSRKMTWTENLKDFKCSKPEFEEYLQVTALYDQNAHMGQTHIFMYREQIVGYVVLAMAHMLKPAQKRLDIDTYGDIPALLISHLATHKEYEHRGIGRNMVSWATRYAKRTSKKMGCRVVLVRSDPDVVGFYEKIGFSHVAIKSDAQSGSFLSAADKRVRQGFSGFFLECARRCMGQDHPLRVEEDTENTMYLDLEHVAL